MITKHHLNGSRLESHDYVFENRISDGCSEMRKTFFVTVHDIPAIITDVGKRLSGPFNPVAYQISMTMNEIWSGN